MILSFLEFCFHHNAKFFPVSLGSFFFIPVFDFRSSFFMVIDSFSSFF